MGKETKKGKKQKEKRPLGIDGYDIQIASYVEKRKGDERVTGWQLLTNRKKTSQKKETFFVINHVYLRDAGNIFLSRCDAETIFCLVVTHRQFFCLRRATSTRQKKCLAPQGRHFFVFPRHVQLQRTNVFR